MPGQAYLASFEGAQVLHEGAVVSRNLALQTEDSSMTVIVPHDMTAEEIGEKLQLLQSEGHRCDTADTCPFCSSSCAMFPKLAELISRI